MKKVVFVFCYCLGSLLIMVSFDNPAKIYKVTDGKVTFASEASFETISATSEKLNGMFDTLLQEFAFSVTTKSFEGFNGLLQREHFNESYLESDKFPKSFFTGKIIEKVPFYKPGIYNVRAKGILKIHGIDQERIIKCDIQIEKETIKFTCRFSVLLADHDITVPRIVFDKISPEIKIQIEAILHEKTE